MYQKVKNAGGHKTYTCEACRKAIRPGQRYHTWKFNRGSRFFRHVNCGPPSRASLTNSKMATVFTAVDEFDPTACESVEDIKLAIDEVASAARTVAGEYEDAAAAIMERFTSGNPTSEACQATASELSSWADELERWDPQGGEPVDGDGDTREDWLEACRQEAHDIIDNVPEYQG